jgi:predicted ATPase/class 3 adenylate cyclase
LGDEVVSTTVAALQELLENSDRQSLDLPAARAPLQRKQVTILFANVAGLTSLAAGNRETEWLEVINLLWRRLGEIITLHGGIIDKYIGDVVMGLFGVPFARENDPERAIQCALALEAGLSDFVEDVRQWSQSRLDPHLQTRPALEDLALRIGINTGPVSLGEVGTDAELTVYGDAVNVASHIEKFSPGRGIYVSHDTYRLTRDLFEAKPLEVLVVKGRREPVPVYQITGIRPRLFFPAEQGIEGVVAPMVGRGKELTRLQQLLRATAGSGSGKLLVISGEAGVGKSRLMREFNRWLERFPIKATIFRGRTEQQWQQIPYALIRDMFTAYFGIQDNDRAAFAEEKLVKGMASFVQPTNGTLGEADIRERARAIGQLIGLNLVEPDVLSNLAADAPQLRDQAIGYLLDFLAAVTERSAVGVLFLEDIHWADNESLELLERLAALSERAPLLIVCLARPSLFERHPAWLGKTATGVQTMPLPPLTEADSFHLVEEILYRLPDTPPALTELIVNTAGGNPYYVEELIKVLIEDGVILPGPETWQLHASGLTRVRIPSTLSAVLQSRLDRLPEVERLTLQRAAVVGREFWDTVVQYINRQTNRPYGDEQITAALEALMQRNMIYRAPASVFTGSQAYHFRHAVLREVAYESVLLRDRPTYHRAVADWLAEQSGERAAEYAAPIATHYELAGEQTKAARMYELAAMRADEQDNPQAAAEYYGCVLALLSNLPYYLDRQLRVRERLGRVLKRQGRLIEARAAFQAMQESAELEGNLLLQARAEIELTAIDREQGAYAAMLAGAERAERLAWLVGAHVELHQALSTKAAAHLLLKQADGAIEPANQALELAMILDSPAALSLSLSLIAEVWLAAGDDSQATPYLAQLLEQADALADGQANDAAYAYLLLGKRQLQLGDQREGIAFLQRALSLYRAAKTQLAISDTLEALARATCRAGRPGDAVDYCREALAIGEATGNEYGRLHYRLGLAQALLMAGRHEQAGQELCRVIEAAEDEARIGRWCRLAEARALLRETHFLC